MLVKIFQLLTKVKNAITRIRNLVRNPESRFFLVVVLCILVFTVAPENSEQWRGYAEKTFFVLSGSLILPLAATMSKEMLAPFALKKLKGWLGIKEVRGDGGTKKRLPKTRERKRLKRYIKSSLLSKTKTKRGKNNLSRE